MSKGFDAFGDSAVLDLGEMEGTTHTFSNQPDSALDGDDDFDKTDTDQLLGPGGKPSGLKSYSFWSMEFYQQFFDVDTDDVTKRVLWSVVPRPGGHTENFFKNKIRSKPDLYGPFWICVTLIFSVAISGNVASYLQSDTSFKWHYDFHKVSIVSSAVFGYAWVTPALLFFAIWWTGTKSENPDPEASSGLTFLELLCLYGYSLAIFIPLSVLWLIQLSALQWILVFVGFGMSGGVLALSLRPDLTKKSPKFGTILLIVVVALHLLLACGFMLAFFHAPATPVQDVQPAAKNVTAGPNSLSESGKSDNSKEKREEKVDDSVKQADKVEANAKDVKNEPGKTSKAKAEVKAKEATAQKAETDKEPDSTKVKTEKV